MVLAIVFVSYLYFYADISSPNYANYVASLIFLATFFPLIILIYQYQENNNELEKEKSKDVVRNLENDSINLEMLFMTHYPYLAKLYQQIYHSDITSQLQLPTLTPDETKRQKFYEMHVCSILFQYIENTLLTSNAYNISPDDPQSVEWILNWQTWFQSDIVRSAWTDIHKFYGKNTQDFIDEYILPVHDNYSSMYPN